MKITLIHNPGAGTGAQPGAKALRKLIEAAGHTVRYYSSKAEGWEKALRRPADLVAVAGGDGTTGRVLRRMVGRKLPVAVLPLGTANNFARSLGTAGMPIEQHIAGWAGARKVKVDAGAVAGPWESTHFIEGLGVGLFAWLMPKAGRLRKQARAAPAGEVVAAIKALKKRLLAHAPKRVNATLDGRDISGDYVLFEILNTQFIGPNLYLSPYGHLGDGLLDVVMIGEKERDHFGACLSKWQRGRPSLPQLPTLRGRRVSLQHGDYDVHVDDRIYGRSDAPQAGAIDTIEVKVLKGALQLLVPI